LSGRGSENIDDFLRHGIVAVGDPQLGPVPLKIKKDELLKLYAEKYPAEKEASRATWASQLLRFITELKTGDEVATAHREQRKYLLGRILSDYEWAPNLIADMPHTRRVQWTQEVNRDQLTPATKNTLGSALTLFKVNADVDKELHAHAISIGAEAPALTPAPQMKKAAEIEEEQLANDYLERADEFIEDAIDALDWSQIQDLVAGLLRAMGYRTTTSERGPDRGVDIFASPDGLGLQEPRIFVEVKHRSQVIGSKEIRAFLGRAKEG
jgi:restriction system protein